MNGTPYGYVSKTSPLHVDHACSLCGSVAAKPANQQFAEHYVRFMVKSMQAAHQRVRDAATGSVTLHGFRNQTLEWDKPEVFLHPNHPLLVDAWDGRRIDNCGCIPASAGTPRSRKLLRQRLFSEGRLVWHSSVLNSYDQLAAVQVCGQTDPIYRSML